MQGSGLASFFGRLFFIGHVVVSRGIPSDGHGIAYVAALLDASRHGGPPGAEFDLEVDEQTLVAGSSGVV